MFEACLHLMKPFEAEELVLVLVFGQEAWPPVSRLLRDAVQLRVSSHLLISSDRGRGKRAFQINLRCRHIRRGPRAPKPHAPHAKGVRPNRLTCVDIVGFHRRSHYPLNAESSLTPHTAGRNDGLVDREVAVNGRPR